MYKYEKDALNIEKAKQYNSEINQEKNLIVTEAKPSISNVNRQILTNDSSDDYSYLNNQATLKNTCSSFINNNQPLNYNDYSKYRSYSINYNSPEVLLQASYLNSLYAMPHTFSDKAENDE
ncbi:MAG: hypothetical protein Q4F66_00245 [Clostridium sp.]|nr:hypothetical protein [Clostridium sp.]